MNYLAKISIMLLALILIIGYVLSDDIFYKKTISANHLKTPVEVFDWATRNYGNKPGVVHTNASPKHLMLKHKDLYCDEGAIVMATLDHKLGYKTRLIDLIGPDSIAHHTILQIYDQGKWINADFTNRTYDSTLVYDATKLNVNLKGERIKPYPRFYNFVINNNYFMKKLALTLRGINENGG